MIKSYRATWKFQRRLGLRWYRYPALGVWQVVVNYWLGWLVVDGFIWPGGQRV